MENEKDKGSEKKNPMPVQESYNCYIPHQFEVPPMPPVKPPKKVEK